jgi:phage-related protein
MTTFLTFVPPGDINASPGSAVTVKPRIRAAQFGDGYVQRTPDGINSMLASFSLEITNMTRAEALTVCNFFAQQGGYIPFWFKAPGDSANKKWICTEWTRADQGARAADVRATLVEVVDP